MQYKTFDEFMQFMCPVGGKGGSDGAEAAYESWVGNLDAQEVWNLAEKWGEYQFGMGQARGLERAGEILNK